jgi:hypothetical protein
MTPQEIREFKLELLDSVHELATEPVADLDGVKQRVEEFFAQLEADSGKEET